MKDYSFLFSKQNANVIMVTNEGSYISLINYWLEKRIWGKTLPKNVPSFNGQRALYFHME